MADIRKFLDQSGVSTLWTRVAEEVKKVDDKAAANVIINAPIPLKNIMTFVPPLSSHKKS